MKSPHWIALAAAVLCFVPCSPAMAQVFNTTAGNQIYEFTTNDDVSAQPTSAVFSTFTRNTVTATATANVFNSQNWSTAGVIDTTRYVTFTLTPNAGFQLDLQSLTFDSSRSGTGPSTAEVRYSTDGFATSTSLAAYAVSTSNTNTVWDFVDFSATSAVAFRFYGYGAGSTGGTMRYDNVYLTGGASPVPEPVHVLLACGLFVAGGRGLRRLKRAMA